MDHVRTRVRVHRLGGLAGDSAGEAAVSYRDHYQYWGDQSGALLHSWRADLDARLRWLYGDVPARKKASAPDVDLWRRLGRKVRD